MFTVNALALCTAAIAAMASSPRLLSMAYQLLSCS